MNCACDEMGVSHSPLTASLKLMAESGRPSISTAVFVVRRRDRAQIEEDSGLGIVGVLKGALPPAWMLAMSQG